MTTDSHTRAQPTDRQRIPPLLLFWNSWGLLILSALVTALLVYYLTRVAPSLVPVPEGVTVPFPAATRWLEQVCVWCGQHPDRVTLAALALLILGAIFRNGSYNVWLLSLVSLALAFSYFSISAPIDRFLYKIENTLPERREVPDYLPGEVRKGR